MEENVLVVRVENTGRKLIRGALLKVHGNVPLAKFAYAKLASH